ncbi:hypothetical protein M011DRAFT_458628 [Sporormia fimetaria CBS 119925]|uniref:Uncharacterized protein n=1 Tax=Sporormia fimetaria CBS 119925 TaxID=1340428 RepID=A0A6A6VDZ3_9PLEO|nr:hypothetical protein M011DRAFT_458628 [Sporormia fimetaria CBS 119925]
MAPIASNTDPDANAHISAAILFTAREMKDYLRWQRQLPPSSRFVLLHRGRLPNAEQYHEYTNWREARAKEADEFIPNAGLWINQCSSDYASSTRDGSSTSEEKGSDGGVRTARSCKHVLHPTTAYDSKRGVEMCPCCTVTAHLKYMDRLTSVLDNCQGSPYDEAKSGARGPVARAWRAGKLQFANVLQKLEEAAEVEAAWQAANPCVCLGDTMSASRALKMYCDSVKASPSETQFNRSCKNKRVSFGTETRFEPGRPESYFRRTSVRYEPGRYANWGDAGWTGHGFDGAEDCRSDTRHKEDEQESMTIHYTFGLCKKEDQDGEEKAEDKREDMGQDTDTDLDEAKDFDGSEDRHIDSEEYRRGRYRRK